MGAGGLSPRVPLTLTTAPDSLQLGSDKSHLLFNVSQRIIKRQHRPPIGSDKLQNTHTPARPFANEILSLSLSLSLSPFNGHFSRWSWVIEDKDDGVMVTIRVNKM